MDPGAPNIAQDVSRWSQNGLTSMVPVVLKDRPKYRFEMIPDPLNDSTMATDSLKNVTAEIKKVGSAE